MARLETVDTLRTSGYSLTILREGDDFKTFTEDILQQMREGAEGRMVRALDHMLASIRRVLSKRYPVVRAGGQRGFSRFADPMVNALRRSRAGIASERRQPSPPGAPPGQVSGGLAESWQRRKPTWSKAKTVLTGRYFSKHPAAGALEWGSPKQKIPSHPYIRPTLVREAGALGGILEGTD